MHDPVPIDPEWVKTAARALADSVGRSLEGAHSATVLYSGGLDSSLIGWLGRGYAPLNLLCVGEKDSPDRLAAARGAELLGLPLVEVEVEPALVLDARARYRVDLERADGPSVPVALGTAMALERARDRRVLCGQGADELFLGYAHFGGLSPSAATERREVDLRRLRGTDWPIVERIARRLGRDLCAPYLDREVERVARQAPIESHLSGPHRKPLLRAVASSVGLPDPLANRPKKAFQYGSGIDRMLRRTRPVDPAGRG